MKQLICLLHLLCVVFNVLSKEDALSEKVQQLTELSFKKPLVRFNSERFKHYVKSQPRNYSVFIMLTALSPQRQCRICKDAHDEFEVVAKNYRYSKAFSNKVFFGMVDFDDAPDIFQYLKLNSAPVFIHFPPKSSPTKADYMDINRREFSVETVTKWVYDCANIRIQIIRQPNYAKLLPIILSGTLVLILLYIKKDSTKYLYHPIIWGIITVGIVCFYISGQAWNRINKPPFISKRTDFMGLFADDSNMQYVVETYVVFLLYFGFAIGIILLNEAPRLKSRRGIRQSIMAFVGLATVILLFSLILSVFRSKYQGYPYSFLIK